MQRRSRQTCLTRQSRRTSGASGMPPGLFCPQLWLVAMLAAWQGLLWRAATCTAAAAVRVRWRACSATMPCSVHSDGPSHAALLPAGRRSYAWCWWGRPSRPRRCQRGWRSRCRPPRWATATRPVQAQRAQRCATSWVQRRQGQLAFQWMSGRAQGGWAGWWPCRSIRQRMTLCLLSCWPWQTEGAMRCDLYHLARALLSLLGCPGSAGGLRRGSAHLQHLQLCP